MSDAPHLVPTRREFSFHSAREAAVLQGNFRKPPMRDNFILDVAFEAAPGFTILFGASGAGKTTLLDCVAGLAKPDSGRISLASEPVRFALGINVTTAKRRVGYVFQNLALFPAHDRRTERGVRLGASFACRSNAHAVRDILKVFRI